MRSRAIVFALPLVVVVSAAIASLEARQAGAPLPPTLQPASVSGNLVELAWAASPAGGVPTSYQIQAGSGPGLANLAVLGVAAVPTLLQTSAPPGTYYVRIVAINAQGISAPSNEIIVTVGGPGTCALPAAPTGLTSTVSGGSVTLRWEVGAGGGPPSGFTLLVGSTPGAANLGIFAGGFTLSLTSPAPAGQYFVRVAATNSCGTSAPSNETSFAIGGGGATGVPVPAGIYNGTMSGHSRFGLPPITSFTLQLGQAVPATAAASMLSGSRWTDNRGCVKTTGIFGYTSTAGSTISVESLTCNDGDLTLRVTSVTGNSYSGVCASGGPNCTFQMTRQ